MKLLPDKNKFTTQKFNIKQGLKISNVILPVKTKLLQLTFTSFYKSHLQSVWNHAFFSWKYNERTQAIKKLGTNDISKIVKNKLSCDSRSSATKDHF